MKLRIINGPNLNLLGKREPEIYGNKPFEEFLLDLMNEFNSIELDYFQSNIEGEIINAIHASDADSDGIVLNAGAYTHTSIAIGDAVAAIKTPVIEVHISNVMNREEIRHISYISKHSIGVISGFGTNSYRLAILQFIQNYKQNNAK
jgi:3-dehydroquinate dehydratase II